MKNKNFNVLENVTEKSDLKSDIDFYIRKLKNDLKDLQVVKSLLIDGIKTEDEEYFCNAKIWNLTGAKVHFKYTKEKNLKKYK